MKHSGCAMPLNKSWVMTGTRESREIRLRTQRKSYALFETLRWLSFHRIFSWCLHMHVSCTSYFVGKAQILWVQRISPKRVQNTVSQFYFKLCLDSNHHLSKSFTAVIRPLSTRLIIPNFHVSLSHRRSTTVSLETRILFNWNTVQYSLGHSQTQ